MTPGVVHPPEEAVDLSTWCEIDLAGLAHNLRQIRRRLQPGCQLGVVVKADAYGHGMLPCARAALEAGAQRLIVNDIAEVCALRQAGIEADVYVCGPLLPSQAPAAVASGAAVVVHDGAVIDALSQAAAGGQRPVRLHLKVETGTHRQGIGVEDVVACARDIRLRSGLVLEGLTTHFADLEDNDDHTFARRQLQLLIEARRQLAGAGLAPAMMHAASSAAAVLLPESQLDMVRAGIVAYGLWPSSQVARRLASHLSLRPVLQWRARLLPGCDVRPGESIGYGRTYRVGSGAVRRQAVLTVGYHDGFDRRRSNTGYVLVDGRPAPLRGRVCMNMSMVEPPFDVAAGAVATLIGRDGGEQISADLVAVWTATINYDVLARIHPRVARICV